MWWLLALLGCGDPSPAPVMRALPTPEVLDAHCREVIGEPRVEQISDRIWVALGYDLANTILIATDAGNVVVDVGMNPQYFAAAWPEERGEDPWRLHFSLGAL